jgi:hypothetical protein
MDPVHHVPQGLLTNMRVDLCRCQVFVTEKLLEITDIAAVTQHVPRARMAEHVGAPARVTAERDADRLRLYAPAFGAHAGRTTTTPALQRVLSERLAV